MGDYELALQIELEWWDPRRACVNVWYTETERERGRRSRIEFVILRHMEIKNTDTRSACKHNNHFLVDAIIIILYSRNESYASVLLFSRYNTNIG